MNPRAFEVAHDPSHLFCAFRDVDTASTAQSVDWATYLANPSVYGNVVLMRHELAPGGGDPGNFSVNDCTTQRNLNDVGRQRSIDSGQQWSDLGFQPDRVFSSPWCRCLETAELLNLAVSRPTGGWLHFSKTTWIATRP